MSDAPGPASGPANSPSRGWKTSTLTLCRWAGNAVFSTAVLVALIGHFGQKTLAKREEEITIRSNKDSMNRTYTELMARREEAATTLRKDMFATILTEVMEE